LSNPVFSKLLLLISDLLIKLSNHFFLTSYVLSSKFHRSLFHPPRKINLFFVPTIAVPQCLPTDFPLVIIHSCRIPMCVKKRSFARGDMCFSQKRDVVALFIMSECKMEKDGEDKSGRKSRIRKHHKSSSSCTLFFKHLLLLSQAMLLNLLKDAFNSI